MRRPIFSAAILACSLVVGCAAPNANVSALAGKWKNAGGTLYFSDGTTGGNPPQVQCWTEFLESRQISECTTSSGRNKIVYLYRLLGPGKYRAEVLENKNYPNTVGTRVDGEFRIEGGTLFLTSPVKGSTSKFVVKVVSTWVRE